MCNIQSDAISPHPWVEWDYGHLYGRYSEKQENLAGHEIVEKNQRMLTGFPIHRDKFILRQLM